MTDPNNLLMINIIPNSQFWSKEVTGIRFGTSNQNSYSTTSYPGIVTSGSSCLVVPS